MLGGQGDGALNDVGNEMYRESLSHGNVCWKGCEPIEESLLCRFA